MDTISMLALGFGSALTPMNLTMAMLGALIGSLAGMVPGVGPTPAMMIYGLQPGPTLFEGTGSFVWTIIASMFVGNVMLVVLHLPLVGIWVKLTQIPLRLLQPMILLLCVVGAYSVRNSMFDVLVAIVFGVAGYFLKMGKWPLVPFILCFMLGPLTERSFIQSMSISDGSFSIFVKNPISLIILIVAGVLFSASLLLMRRANLRLRNVGANALE